LNIYHNDNDPFVIEWIKNLARAEHLPHGTFDARSIREITKDDVRRYTQAHFFAGIGGWPLALRYAGWPEDAEVWTGSCPCQPFSSAGRQRGAEDERHLWPEWFRLIEQCRPPAVIGEQVDGPLGRAWLDAVFADLEGSGYSVGAAVLPAAGVGAPHQRHRIYWVAIADGERLERVRVQLRERAARQTMPEARGRGTDGGVGDASSSRDGRNAGEVSGAQEDRRPHGREPDVVEPPGWDDPDWIPCRDHRHGIVYRPVESGLEPLASGISNRLGRLRAYGNAIVPEVAATFIGAVVDVLTEE
jgi:DNA (cytosine-5)-methyltransferase 1